MDWVAGFKAATLIVGMSIAVTAVFIFGITLIGPWMLLVGIVVLFVTIMCIEAYR